MTIEELITFLGLDGTVERRNHVERVAEAVGIDFDKDTVDKYQPERE